MEKPISRQCREGSFARVERYFASVRPIAVIRRQTALLRSGKYLAPIVVPAILIAASGCANDQKPLAPVSGIVTFNGKPLANGSVSFQPIAPPGSNIAGKGSEAMCDENGHFQLQTIEDKPGAVVGEHRVRIFGPKNRQIAPSDDSSSGGAEIIPRRYNFETTLTFTVPPEGTDKANFDLEK
jgi:hypothetical protein